MLLLTTGCAGAVIIASGCPGELDNPEQFPHQTTSTACPNMAARFIPINCGLSDCHSANGRAGGLDLVSPNLAARIVNVPGSSACSGIVLADPDNPEESLIYRKLESEPPCGVQMPREAEPLTAHERECVAQWLGSLTGTNTGTGTGSGGGGGVGGGGGASTGTGTGVGGAGGAGGGSAGAGGS